MMPKFSSTVNVVGVGKPHCPLTFLVECPAQRQLKVKGFFRRRVVNTGVRITGSRFAILPGLENTRLQDFASGRLPRGLLPLFLSSRAGAQAPHSAALCVSGTPSCLYNPQPEVSQDATPRLGFSQPASTPPRGPCLFRYFPLRKSFQPRQPHFAPRAWGSST